MSITEKDLTPAQQYRYTKTALDTYLSLGEIDHYSLEKNPISETFTVNIQITFDPSQMAMYLFRLTPTREKLDKFQNCSAENPCLQVFCGRCQ